LLTWIGSVNSQAATLNLFIQYPVMHLKVFQHRNYNDWN
jgi:hypothetical protein